MELKCPNCGQVIPAENINIQEMVALCSECQHVFAFTRNTVARKAKRRIPPQPRRVHVYADDDGLELSYRLVLGSGPKFGLAMAAFSAILATILLVSAFLRHEPVQLQFVLALAALLFSYITAMALTTTTTITADLQHLEVSSGPLPFPINDDKTLSTTDIARISFEESYQSNSPLSPSYNVYAELSDGARISVVTSLPRLHAHYIACVLDDHLQEEKEVAVTELGEQVIDDTVYPEMLEEDTLEHHHRGMN